MNIEQAKIDMIEAKATFDKFEAQWDITTATIQNSDATSDDLKAAYAIRHFISEDHNQALVDYQDAAELIEMLTPEAADDSQTSFTL